MWTIGNSALAMVLVGAVMLPLMAGPAEIAAVARGTEAGSHHPKIPKGKKVTTVTKQEQGSTIHLDKGSILAVRLEWTPGTGYSWTLENPDRERFRPQGKPVREPADKPMPGAPQTIVFHYKAIKEGSSNFKFVLRRPFEKGVEPVERFTFTAEVSSK
jgi:predicted secreted protein